MSLRHLEILPVVGDIDGPAFTERFDEVFSANEQIIVPEHHRILLYDAYRDHLVVYVAPAGSLTGESGERSQSRLMGPREEGRNANTHVHLLDVPAHTGPKQPKGANPGALAQGTVK